MDKETFLWDKLKHENELFSSRSNFFLVAHTLLVASISTDSAEIVIRVIVPILGVLISVLWLNIGIRNIKIQDEIKSKLIEPVNIAERKPTWLGTHILIGIFMPLLFLFFWLIVHSQKM